VLFDLDGVLTPTAEVHRRAWRSAFTGLFAELGVTESYTEDDYFDRLDGKPRYEGVDDLLRSRGVELPWGSPDDPSDAMTVCGVGNRKNDLVTRILADDGVEPYPGSVAVLDLLRAAGTPIAVVSSSKNAGVVLAAAGLADRFEVVIDGNVAAAEGLAGKPAPDTFLRAAEELGAAPSSTIVVEDAVSGVAAGAAGGFIVIGVDRGAGAAGLFEAGARIVVADLAELLPGSASSTAEERS
jgi:beta-phosphoglucomutase family hydrolase